MPTIRNGLFITAQLAGSASPSLDGLSIRRGSADAVVEGVSFPVYGKPGHLTLDRGNQVPYGHLVVSPDRVQSYLGSVGASIEDDGAVDFIRDLASEALAETNTVVNPQYFGVISRTGVIIDSVGPFDTEIEAISMAEVVAESIGRCAA